MIPEVSIDHVTIAGQSLDRLSTAFAGSGLDPAYGGRHDAMPTHMATIGFPDGSYIELIAKYDDAATSPFWDAAMEHGVGPCAWAVGVEDIVRVSRAIARGGIDVDGPTPYERERPDGAVARWQLAVPGEGEPGEVLPFLIEDETPRDRRVQATVDPVACELRGVAGVVLAVADIEPHATAMERVFDAPAFAYREIASGPLAGRCATSARGAVTLLAPASDTPVAARMERRGRGPCAFILASEDLEKSMERVATLGPTRLGANTVHLVDPAALDGIAYLGITAAD